MFKTLGLFLVGAAALSGCSIDNDDGETAIEQDIMAPPTNVSATAYATTRINVSWTAVPGATKYYVYSSIGAGGPFTLNNTTRAPGTSLQVANLQTNTNYCFVVRTDGPDGVGNASAPVACANTGAVVGPNTPTGVAATFIPDGTRATVTWNAVAGATKYYVFQSIGAAGPYTLINSVLAPSTTLPVAHLTTGTSYCFTVESVSSTGTSAPSVSSCGGNPVAMCGNMMVETGEQCDDGNTTNGDGCSATCQTEVPPAGAVFFSEYIEGSGSNKGLEIRNTNATAFPLNGCVLRGYFNGSATSGTSSQTTLPPAASIPAGGVFTVCNSSGTLFQSTCNATTGSGALLFNGNDAVELVCGTTTLDVIGQIGNDPGGNVGWGTGLNNTLNHTLTRKCSVTAGDTNGADAFDPAVQWVGSAVDTFSGLGMANCAP